MPDPNCFIGGHVSDAGTMRGDTTYTIDVEIISNTGSTITTLTTTTGYLGYWAVTTHLDPNVLAEVNRAKITYKDASGCVLLVDSISLQFNHFFVIRQTLQSLRGAFGRLGQANLAGVMARILNLNSVKFFGVAGWGGQFIPGQRQVVRN